jgi:hypothetical protein
MAFDRSHFSSVNNQQCAGERIQTWQYETIDPPEELCKGDYFREVANNLHTNDYIWVIQMSPDWKVAKNRYAMTVRVAEAEGAPYAIAVADRDIFDTEAYLGEMASLSAESYVRIVDSYQETMCAGATAVLLGTLPAGASIAVKVKTLDDEDACAGTITGPAPYGTAVTIPEILGYAPSPRYDITFKPTAVPAGTPGTIRVIAHIRIPM